MFGRYHAAQDHFDLQLGQLGLDLDKAIFTNEPVRAVSATVVEDDAAVYDLDAQALADELARCTASSWPRSV